jgi:acetyl-CoA C-acetyltransferase
MNEAWIIDTPRTPRGRAKETGGLRPIHPQELMAQILNAALERTGLRDDDVEDVIVGCVTEFGEQGSNLARLAVLAAGWGVDTSGGVTLNRFCGSGQQAVNFAAMEVMTGTHDIAIGGGVESMSRVPMGSDKAGLHGRNAALNELHPLVPQGISGDLIATVEGFDREAVDRFAVSSQQRARQAQVEGRFDRSLVPVRDRDGEVVLSVDEHVRPSTTLEDLARLPASFEAAANQVARGDDLSFAQKVRLRYPSVTLDHVHHAGNSSGLVDGAGAVVIASPEAARARGLVPRARIVSMAVAATDPIMMLTGPTPAVHKALAKAGMTVGDIDLFEVNEAFAAVPLKFIKDLDLDPEKVNVNGGAIALGHPLGATGAMLFGTVLDELERTDRTVGVVTMCIGAGQATATVIERMSAS